MKNPAAKFMIKAIRAYQIYVSPSLAPCCKYIPTCSEYAIEAIALHGAFRGFLLAVWRIIRCNPFSRGGYDPVPPVKHPRRNSYFFPFKTLPAKSGKSAFGLPGCEANKRKDNQ